MKKIEFINDSAPYLSAENLNLLQDNVEKGIEESKLEEYSTGETRIGTWLGKPLYRKTFNITSGISSSFSVDISDLNFDYLKIKDGMIDYVNTQVRYIRPTYFASSIDNFSLFERYNAIQVRIAIEAQEVSYNRISFILEYTKTTD